MIYFIVQFACTGCGKRTPECTIPATDHMRDIQPPDNWRGAYPYHYCPDCIGEQEVRLKRAKFRVIKSEEGYE